LVTDTRPPGQVAGEPDVAFHPGRDTGAARPAGRGLADRVRRSPWGHALSEDSGLDLRRTRPPVAEVIDITTGILGTSKLLFAVQVHETVEPASLAELAARFPWSAMKVYDINAAWRNHGLLLATWGWAVT
jgi:hypothetical protein